MSLKNNIVILLLLICLSGFVSAALTDGLIFYARLEEATAPYTDEFGHDFGSERNVTAQQPGKEDYSIKFDNSQAAGSGGYINTTAGINITDTAGVLRFWINPDSVENDRFLFNTQNPSNNWGLYVRTFSNVIQFGIQGSNVGGGGSGYSEGCQPAQSVLTVGSWNHVMMTWNATGITSYVNNTQVCTQDWSLAGSYGAWTDVRLLVGDITYDVFRSPNAYMDEIAMWNRDLTAQERTNDYNDGTGWFNPLIASPPLIEQFTNGGAINFTSDGGQICGWNETASDWIWCGITSDTTPTFAFTTDENANCSIGNTTSPSTECTTTGATDQVCTIAVALPRKNANQTLYLECFDSSSNYGNYTTNNSYYFNISVPPSAVCGETITTDTTLNVDLHCDGTGITIGADDVELDCDGHLINYSIDDSGSYRGVYANLKNNVTVRNCIINVGNNTATSDQRRGIYYYQVTNSSIINNTIDTEDIGAPPILIITSTGNTITNNTLNSNNDYGFYAVTSDNNDFIGNNFTSNSAFGVYLYISQYNNLTDNDITSSTQTAIYIRTANHTTLTSNRATSTTNYGVRMKSTSHSTLDSNNMTSTDVYGLYSEGPNYYNNYTGNRGISDAFYGFGIFDEYYSNFTSNYLYTNTGPRALHLADSNNNIFTNNVVEANTTIGTYLTASNNNTFIRDNSTGTYGYLLFESSNNTFQDSIEISGSSYDVGITGTTPPSSNNIFLNCSYTTEQVAATNNLTREWYYKVYVNDSEGNLVDGASITSVDTNSDASESGTTDATGYETLWLPEYINHGGTLTYYSNYTVTAATSSLVGQDSVNMSTNMMTQNIELPDSYVTLTNLTAIDYAPNWSSATYTSSNNTTLWYNTGNYTWNLTEYNISVYGLTGNAFNVSNNDTSSHNLWMTITFDENWFNWHCNGVNISTSPGNVIAVPANSTVGINCSLDLIDANQTYDDWVLTEDNAYWNFTYSSQND